MASDEFESDDETAFLTGRSFDARLNEMTADFGRRVADELERLAAGRQLSDADGTRPIETDGVYPTIVLRQADGSNRELQVYSYYRGPREGLVHVIIDRNIDEQGGRTTNTDRWVANPSEAAFFLLDRLARTGHLVAAPEKENSAAKIGRWMVP